MPPHGIETVHRGRLRGAAIATTIKDAACEAVGIQPGTPGVRLRGFCFVGDPIGEWDWPDVEFELAVTRPEWWR